MSNTNLQPAPDVPEPEVSSLATAVELAAALAETDEQADAKRADLPPRTIASPLSILEGLTASQARKVGTLLRRVHRTGETLAAWAADGSSKWTREEAREAVTIYRAAALALGLPLFKGATKSDPGAGGLYVAAKPLGSAPEALCFVTLTMRDMPKPRTDRSKLHAAVLSRI